MAWRPEGWKNPNGVKKFHNPPTVDEVEMTIREICFESGADAMLETLRKEAIVELMPGFTLRTGATKHGWLVFIPNKEE